MSAPQGNEAEKNIEIWKVKKLIKRLEAARGNGTSMISLIIRMLAKQNISREMRMSANNVLLRSSKGSGFPSCKNAG